MTTAGNTSVHDDKLYYSIGAPCNICDPGDYAKIYRMNLDGSNIETIASGVRNTVGFDFDPKNGELWFTNNGRDWMSETCPTTRSMSSRARIRILVSLVLPSGQHPRSRVRLGQVV
ncbi:MAG: hypothetical protein R3E68_20200 [Burkholderiaceae bacterium]